jgi:hypothetical protein
MRRESRDRPWIVRDTEHQTIVLEGPVNFFDWAHERWPAPRWKVELHPWHLAGGWPRDAATR